MNSDRFKFRIWNGEQMISPDYITRDGCGHWKENSIPASSNKLMQCTGLKDVEGKLIYEGDILRWISYEGFEIGDIKGIYVVKWNREGFYELYDPFSAEYWPINDTEFDNIVGNIYEHIHLLPDYESNT